MIKWMFYFEEGSVSTIVKDESLDERIRDSLDSSPKGWIQLPDDTCAIIVNLSLVKCVTREVVKEEEKLVEQKQEG